MYWKKNLSLFKMSSWDLINLFNPDTFLRLSQAWVCISNVIGRGLSSVQRIEVRGDYSFC